MDPMTIWYVVGGIVLAALVIVGLVAVTRRASLRRAEERRQLPSAGTGSGARTGKDSDGGSVDVRGRPTITEPTGTGPETDLAETDVLPEAVETLPLDRPEAPESPPTSAAFPTIRWPPDIAGDTPRTAGGPRG